MPNPNPSQATRFKPGTSGNIYGRPKKLLKRIDEMCHADGRHPYVELMKLLPGLKPRDQAEIWLHLLAYCEPKPKEYIPTDEDLTRAQLKEMSTEELIESIRPHIPPAGKT